MVATANPAAFRSRAGVIRLKKMMESGGAKVFVVLLAFRIANALCIRTFFQPDEYFQALEPAWSIAFGPDSGAWLTWEWQYQLRSSLHPALFAAVYMALDSLMLLLHVPSQLRPAVLVAAPRLVQAVFAALGDYYTWRLAYEVHGRSRAVAAAALSLSVLNPWQWYCATRTFSNSIETTLTVMALYYWPWGLFESGRDVEPTGRKDGPRPSAQNLARSLLLAAVAVVLRPTNLLIWLAILTHMVASFPLSGNLGVMWKAVTDLAGEALACGGSVLALSLLSDRLYYGFWTFPPLKWLQFNISQDLAVFYGRNDWHYYLSQGLPILTTTFLPFVLLGLYKSAGLESRSNDVRALSFAVCATTGALSTISHKEVRFIYPLLPILHVLAAPHACSFFLSLSTSTTPGRESRSSDGLKRKPLLAFIVVINMSVAAYLSLLHQQAPISVLSFLRGEYERLHADNFALGRLTTSAAGSRHQRTDPEDDELFALFLAPCHSSPWRSHLVYPGLRARALTCEPPLHTQPGTTERNEYVDEADRFYSDPITFLARDMWPAQSSNASKIPRYIVGFEGIEVHLVRFFHWQTGEGAWLGVRLRRVWEGWNGFYNEDARRRGRLIVWETGTRDK